MRGAMPIRPGAPALALLVALLAAGPVRAQTPGNPPMIHSNILVLVENGADEPASAGSYLVRVYRRAPGTMERLDFQCGTVRRRDGAIERCWLEDLDRDGRPELLIWVVGAGSGSYGVLDTYTIDGLRLRERRFPGLTDDQDQGYMGHDLFRLRDGIVEREFPLYTLDDTNARPTGGRRLIAYQFNAGRWKKIEEKTLAGGEGG